MQLFSSANELQQVALQHRKNGLRIGFVPTMGYLHSGHTSLFDIARQQCDWLVCSIYVNPLQFAPTEDLDQYPRDLAGDKEKCQRHQVDALFVPEDVYHSDHSTYINVEQLTSGLCGSSRPQHFQGVTTVVARLFGIVQPHVAVFGEKDFQQLAVVQRMVRDLAMPVDVIGGPLIRDHDGLALSSRNRYLTTEQRRRALSLSSCLLKIRHLIHEGTNMNSVDLILKQAQPHLDVDKIDYLKIVHPQTLVPLRTVSGPARALVAGWIGQTRLIDNMDVGL